MFSRSGRGAAARAVALAIAVALTGAPAVFASAHDPEHNCRCPAGTHQCSCARCAAKAGKASSSRCHGTGGEGHADALRPPCHGPAAAAPKESKAPAPTPAGAPCISPSCHDRGPEAVTAAAQEPYVPATRLAQRMATGHTEEHRRPATLAGTGRAAPEPPPPRA